MMKFDKDGNQILKWAILPPTYYKGNAHQRRTKRRSHPLLKRKELGYVPIDLRHSAGS